MTWAADPARVVAGIVKWLGLDATACRFFDFGVVNPTRQHRSGAVARRARAMKSSRYLSRFVGARGYALLRFMYNAVNRKKTKERMAPVTRVWLERYFAPANVAAATSSGGVALQACRCGSRSAKRDEHRFSAALDATPPCRPGDLAWSAESPDLERPVASESLTGSTLRGLQWTYLATAANAGMQIAFTAVMGRLLEPAAFGLIAMSLLALNFSQHFAKLGVGQAVIQKSVISRDEIRASFTSSVGARSHIHPLGGAARAARCDLLPRAGRHGRPAGDGTDPRHHGLRHDRREPPAT